MQDVNKVIVGRLGAAHGVKGWLKIHAFTQNAEDLFSYGPLSFLKDGKWQPLNVEQWRLQGKAYIAKVKGCDSREQVAGFTHCEVSINDAQLPETADDEVYWHQLEGLQVVSVAHGGEQILGCVDQVMATGANDVLVVTPSAESIDDRERLIPYIDHVVKNCDIDAAKISVDWDSDF